MRQHFYSDSHSSTDSDVTSTEVCWNDSRQCPRLDKSHAAQLHATIFESQNRISPAFKRHSRAHNRAGK